MSRRIPDLPEITAAELQAIYRCDLASFVERSFLQLNPTTPYQHNWHIDLIAAKLIDVMEGRCKRLIINIPPRNLKSITVSIAFVAWCLGHYPTHQFMCASYGQDLSNKLAHDTRLIMLAQWYQEIFTATRLSATKSAVEDFQTTAGGGRMAVSVGGQMTGRGCDILIIDDPLKPSEAYSEVARKNANEWFDGTAFSRLNSKKEGAIIIIMQRLHQDDLPGRLMLKDEWEVISLPAIAIEDEHWEFDTPLGPQKVFRAMGAALHPEREPLEVLREIREAQGEYHFAGQYQQSPVPDGGGIVKSAWLQYLPREQFPVKFEEILMSFDTACKAKDLADFSVCTVWGIYAKKVYLIHVWRHRVDFPELRHAAIRLIGEHNPNTLLIEDHASGTQLLQEINRAGIYVRAKPIRPQGDKQVRLHAQCALIEAGNMILPAEAPWLADYVHELTSFPVCKYDDQVDSTTQALGFIHSRLNEPGILTYYRMEAEKRRNGSA